MSEFKIYWALIGASVRARMEYKSSFLFYVFAILTFYMAQIGLLYVVLSRFQNIQGWSLGEIAFLYGLLTFAHGFANLFFAPLIHFEGMLIKGEFDRTLVRPLSPLAQVIFSKFESSTMAHLLIGVGALVIGSRYADLHWTLSKVLYFPVVVAGGVMIAGAVRLFVTSVAFWTLKNESLIHTVVFSSREFIVYPITIYNFGIQFFLSFVFPIAFINFYPSHYFLDRTGDGLLFPVLQYGTPLVGLALFLLSLLSWRIGINHYQSSGS